MIKEGVPLNRETAYSDNELKLYFNAAKIKPKKGCNPHDTDKNGSMGCFIDTPDY